MEESKPSLGLFFISLSLLFFAGVLTFLSWHQYQSIEKVIPDGSYIADIPITGLSPEEAIERVRSVYGLPVELAYRGSRIRLEIPESLDFGKLKEQLTAAINSVYAQNSFFNFLLGKYSQEPIRIQLSFNELPDSVRKFLQDEIAPRYDIIPMSVQPEGNGFMAGHSGRSLDINAALPLIDEARKSGSSRSAELPVTELEQPAANIQNLALMLRATVDTWQDRDQVTEIYLSDPSSGQSLDIARRNREDLIPEIAFTAASTMKLPIMVSSYARMDEEPSAFTMKTLRLMITESKNDQTDWMMENIIGGSLAPFAVTEDLEKLGLTNSFLAGYFYLGAPLLELYHTDANSRTDINLNPDVYNQTTAKDMGVLMDALYRCSEDGSGLLTSVFPGKITRKECSEMIELLKDNLLPYLISAGVPDSVPVAHKHGWIEENDGLLHTMGNIAAVYSPGGDYILSIYTWHPENLIFDEGNILFSQISSTVYNYFNPAPIPEFQEN
ncbi:MAG: serine hydrolase [Anaerolineaceae bacterium]|nr:serine hydrolase [Anaerolineaceae bacterium]